MPIARIRTLDPEAISFLAARLAAAGFQLQFSGPNDTDLNDADLEIIVTRMDSATALQQARIQAEEMGVDVTVMPGALDTVAPAPSSDQAPEPVIETSAHETYSDRQELPASTPGHPARWTTPYHADLPEDANEFVHAQASDPDETQPLEPSQPSAADAIASRLKHSAESLAAFTQSSAARLADWNRRTAEARAQRRTERERQERAEQQNREQLARENEQRRLLELPNTPGPYASDKTSSSKPRLASTTKFSRRLSHRDQNYRKAAIIAAALLLAIMLGWGLIGMRSPANPIGGSNLSNVQQQTPFGAASVAAPVQTAAPSLRPAANPHSPAVRAARSKPAPTHHARNSNIRHRTARSSSSNDREVVVRHFGSKPVAQQAKAKSKDGVKVITEE
jgi:hypothetical protein